MQGEANSNIPIGSIRRLLKWAEAQIEGKENPYTEQDGKSDIKAVDKWVNQNPVEINIKIYQGEKEGEH